MFVMFPVEKKLSLALTSSVSSPITTMRSLHNQLHAQNLPRTSHASASRQGLLIGKVLHPCQRPVCCRTSLEAPLPPYNTAMHYACMDTGTRPCYRQNVLLGTCCSAPAVSSSPYGIFPEHRHQRNGMGASINKYCQHEYCQHERVV